MVYLKTKEEIEIMRKAGQIAARAMEVVARHITPGVKLKELDKLALETIESEGAESSFKKVPGYNNTICATPNDWVVHGIPGNEVLKSGDIVGIDLGAYYKGFHSDMAKTIPVGKVSGETKKFLAIGDESLRKALKKAKTGKYIGDISSTIQNLVESAGFSVVRDFVGHGVGRQLHEEPLIPGYGQEGTGPQLKKGMVIAIEVIYNKGKKGVRLLSDGWTAATIDGELSGLFELTVAITEKGPLVLTKS